MNEIVKVTEQDRLSEILKANDRVVVKFTAPSWCIPCRNFAPAFEAVSELVEDATFVSVDIDDAPWAPEEYDFRGVPFVILFENGKRVRDLRERTAVKFLKEME